MLTDAIYVLLVIAELLLLGGISTYAVLLLYSWLRGAPYVPTDNKEIEGILRDAHLKKGMTFLELGSGDGRVTRKAAKLYGVKGIGIDVNPELNLRANMIARSENLKNISFETKDINHTDFSKADVIYIFLFPKLIEQMKDKLQFETKGNVFIISHGFEIPFLNHMFVKERKGKKFSTFYYKKN